MDLIASDDGFRLIQALIFVGFVLHRAYYHRRYRASEEDTLERQLPTAAGRAANFLALPALVGLALYIFKPTWMAWGALQVPIWGRWIGVLLATAGFALLQWSHRALGHNWSDQPRITRSQTLTTSGPYRWVRHPMYSSFLLILGSPVLIAANWFIGSLWLVTSALDIRDRIRFEEARLSARFGQAYRNYVGSTGAILPRLW